MFYMKYLHDNKMFPSQRHVFFYLNIAKIDFIHHLYNYIFVYEHFLSVAHNMDMHYGPGGQNLKEVP